MVFNMFVFNSIVDLTNPAQTGTTLSNLAMPLIQNLLQELKNGTLNLSQYPFTKVQSSGLTSQSGLYIIANSKTKKIYLGGASDLAQRKGDHKRTFTDPAKKVKLQTGLRHDLDNGNFTDFHFIPVLIFNQSQVVGLTTTKTINQQIGAFLDTYVEGPLLNQLFTTNPSDLYNTKQVGPFQKGNTFGGSPNSGASSEAVAYETKQNPPRLYAWESVSALANCFGVDRKLVRVKRQQQILKPLTKQEYASFNGTKISNTVAKNFANRQGSLGSLNITQVEYDLLLKELFPGVANKRNQP